MATIDPLDHFIYGHSLNRALQPNSENTGNHISGTLFKQTSLADVVYVTANGKVTVRDGLQDEELRLWLREPPPATQASARLLFLDAVPNQPDTLPVTEGAFREMVDKLAISSRFLDLFWRQHMPGRHIHRSSDEESRTLGHEMWWSAVRRSQIEPGFIGAGKALKGHASLSRNVAWWQRFALWSNYSLRMQNVAAEETLSTATYVVFRCPTAVKRFFFEAVKSDSGRILTGHPLAVHAYFMEHIIRETYEICASFSSPLYQWENRSDMMSPEDYSDRSKAFLSLSRQMHQISTDHDILTASANQLNAESQWFADQINDTGRRRSHTDRIAPPASVAMFQESVEDISANLVKEVALISTYMRLYLERSKIGVSECYAMISQRDSEINIKMAQSTREENESINVIQIMSMVFLPGSLVSGIFGMGFFTADVRDDTAFFMASSNWWLYLVVAVPFTVLVVLFMSYYPWMSRKVKGWRFGRQRDISKAADMEAIAVTISSKSKQ